MGAEYLIDTNVIIDFSANKLPSAAYTKVIDTINSSPKISIINKIELLSLADVPSPVVFFTEEAHVFALSEEIVSKTIELRKKHKIKLPDAIIAATALVHNLKLLTHNIGDFNNIKGLKVVDSHHIALK